MLIKKNPLGMFNYIFDPIQMSFLQKTIIIKFAIILNF